MRLEMGHALFADQPQVAVYQSTDMTKASSSLVKIRLQNGEPVHDLVEPEVFEIIVKYGFYGIGAVS